MRRTKDTTRIVTIPELMPYLLVKLPILMVLRCFESFCPFFLNESSTSWLYDSLFLVA